MNDPSDPSLNGSHPPNPETEGMCLLLLSFVNLFGVHWLLFMNLLGVIVLFYDTHISTQHFYCHLILGVNTDAQVGRRVISPNDLQGNSSPSRSIPMDVAARLGVPQSLPRPRRLDTQNNGPPPAGNNAVPRNLGSLSLRPISNNDGGNNPSNPININGPPPPPAAAAAAAAASNDTQHNNNHPDVRESILDAYLIDSVTQEPPVEGVYLGWSTFSRNVYEYTTAFRLISIQGTGRAFRNVLHPITREACRRDLALARVQRVPANIQVLLTQERRRMGLSPVDEQPITQADQDRMDATIQAVQAQ